MSSTGGVSLTSRSASSASTSGASSPNFSDTSVPESSVSLSPSVARPPSAAADWKAPLSRSKTACVVPDPLPEPVLTFYGAAQLGAVTRFSDTLPSADPRVVVAPAEREEAFDLPPGHHLVVYGDPPTEATTTHWETEVWSENPAVHPTSVEGTDPLLAVGDRTYSHVDAVSTGSGAGASERPEAGERVAVQGSFEDPDVVIDGLVEPIAAGATITLTE